jgi:dihydropteroate synthase
VKLDCAGRSLALDQVAIMGVLNVTPDSFSDGGQYQNISDAIHHAQRLVSEGADLIDVGGESTRPGSRGTDAAEEIQRVVPVIRRLMARLPVPISIDTSKPEVMTAAVAAGAGLINDVRALRADGAIEAVRDLGVPVCLMHMQDKPETMGDDPRYQNVVREVGGFLRQRVDACIEGGISEQQLLIDPGFGFGKNFDHNRSLLLELDVLVRLGLPVTVGFSRKGFVGALLGDLNRDRAIGSAGLALLAVQKGARIVRVHDVVPTRDLIRSWERLQGDGGHQGNLGCARTA